MVRRASLSALVLVAACSSSSSSPSPGGTGPVDSGPPPEASSGCIADPGPTSVTVDPNAASDPIGGADKFTLAQALAGFPSGSGKLVAILTTDKSAIRCELAETAAPQSVANFVGLARGTRPYKQGTVWKVGRFYDGLTFHRVIPNFVIQGGDPLGDGTGGPGYDMVVENQVAEPKGTLAMAAASKPSGSQFYIVVGTGPAPNYDVFGSCDTDVAAQIASVERDANDRPKVPVHIQRIDIERCP
jgi:peptidyl-prolyl cis-trans isomerase A (cyclophilin A)